MSITFLCSKGLVESVPLDACLISSLSFISRSFPKLYNTDCRRMSGEVEENVPIFLSFSNLGVEISDRQILQNVSGKVHPGEMLAVMGPSGKYILLPCACSFFIFSTPKKENVRFINNY